MMLVFYLVWKRLFRAINYAGSVPVIKNEFEIVAISLTKTM